VYFGRALGAARGGDLVSARRDVEKLQALQDALSQAKNAYWAEQVEIQRQAATAWVSLGEGRQAEAIGAMRSAADLEDASEKHIAMENRLVPMRDWTHDLAAMAGAIDERTRLVFVANPNNPTGTWNRRGEVEALVGALPAGCLLVLDEAYFEYADDAEYPDGVALVRSGAPVIVTRTFSKVYGLGGLRAGYAIAAPEVLEAVLTIREAFGTNAVAQAAAAAALDDVEHVRRSVQTNRVEKARVAGALAERGFTVLPSLANFVTFDTGAEGREVFRRLLARGVIVRPLDPYDMRSWLRVSIGTPEENTAFLAALDALGLGTPR